MPNVPLEYSEVRFQNQAEATRAVAAVQSLLDCPLGAAFRHGSLEAKIFGSSVEWEPVLYFSAGAKAAARLAGLRLPEGRGPVAIDEARQPSLLTTPMTPLEQAASALQEAKIHEADKALRVLIVEDHADTALALADLVEAWGCRAAIAPTARDARQLASRFHPRVVLLDLGLPDEHGYKVAEDIRRTTSRDELSFVVVTGWSQPVDQVASAVAGISHHLVKPVNPDVLRTILSSYRSAATAPALAQPAPTATFQGPEG